MIGDDMAVLSGGMYGASESDYTRAIPSFISQAGKNAIYAGAGAKILGRGVGLFGIATSARAENKQYNANIRALQEEKRYNVANYEQYIADMIASNKMSFYSSGLDYNTGTARDVIENNRQAATADMNRMIKNYDTQIKSLKQQRDAAAISGVASFASTALTSFI